MQELLLTNSGNWDSQSISLAPTRSLTVAPLQTPEARVGKCYDNVLDAISRHGGDAVYGWALTDLGPHRISGATTPAPLYRRWLNHVVWRDASGKLWELSPNTVIGETSERHFWPTEFIPDPAATFEIVSQQEWFTRGSRYLPVRPEGFSVCEYLTKAQHAASSDERNAWLRDALQALTRAGFVPREWKVEMVGKRTGSIWLIAE